MPSALVPAPGCCPIGWFLCYFQILNPLLDQREGAIKTQEKQAAYRNVGVPDSKEVNCPGEELKDTFRMGTATRCED